MKSDSRRFKILLTGAAGALGSAIRQVAGEEIELVCMDIEPRGVAGIHQGSFTDAVLMRKLMTGCDAVIHTAALHGGHRLTHTPTQYTEVNVAGLVTLLELCGELQVKRFVFSSTMEVQIGRDWMASGMAVVDERTAANPDWIYPLNKLQCEQAGSHYHYMHGIEFVALRYMEFTRETVPCVDLLARVIMPADVARANLLAATRMNIGYEVLNVGPETPLTQQDIAQAAESPCAVVDKYWPGASAVLQASGVELNLTNFWPVTRIDRAKRVLGWQPEVTFETYLTSLGWQKG